MSNENSSDYWQPAKGQHLAADAVILASPNYAANVSWLTKNCIDRFAYTCHRPKYFNQKFLLLVTSGSYMGVKPAMKALSILVSGGKIVSRLAVFFSPDMNAKKTALQEAKIQKTTKRFVKSLSANKPAAPPFSYLIWFSVFKASSELSKTTLPADYQFYKSKDYFTDDKLNLLQKAAITVFTHFFRFMIQKGLV